MGRAITSATFKKFTEDIEQLCKNYVDNKINFIKEISKYEMEILEIAKQMYVDDSEKYFNNENKVQKNLSNLNIYNNIKEKEYFSNNFIKIVSSKFLDIFNHLNNSNYSYEDKDKPLVLIFIKVRLEQLQKILNDCSKDYFEKQVYEKIYIKYFRDLRKQQSIRSKEFNTKNQILDESEIEKNFKEELFKFYKNEFFKYFFCIILKLFMNNLKKILIDNYQKELKENENMVKIINQKAEKSLKYVTQKLKADLLNDLDKYFPKEEEKQTNEDNELKNGYSFDY